MMTMTMMMMTMISWYHYEPTVRHNEYNYSDHGPVKEQVSNGMVAAYMRNDGHINDNEEDAGKRAAAWWTWTV